LWKADFVQPKFAPSKTIIFAVQIIQLCAWVYYWTYIPVFIWKSKTSIKS